MNSEQRTANSEQRTAKQRTASKKIEDGSLRPCSELHFIILFNCAPHALEQCLESIFKLNYPLEKIGVSVVEYGRKHSQAQHLREEYPHVSFFFLSQRSRSFAQNYLVDKITSNFLAYVDGETVVDKDWATHCVRAIQGQGIGASCSPVSGMEKGPCFELKASAMLVKRNCLKKIGLFRPILRSWEGFDLSQRLLAGGFHLALAPLAKSSGKIFPFLFGDYGKHLWFFFQELYSANSKVNKGPIVGGEGLCFKFVLVPLPRRKEYSCSGYGKA